MTAITIDDVKAPDVRALLRYAPSEIRSWYLEDDRFRDYLDKAGPRTRDQFLTGVADGAYPLELAELYRQSDELYRKMRDDPKMRTPENKQRLDAIYDEMKAVDPDPKYPEGWKFSRWQAKAAKRLQKH